MAIIGIYFRPRRIAQAHRVSFILWLGCAGLMAAQSVSPLPSGDEVMAKVVERARQVAAQDVRQQYTYVKRAVTEELDARGEVKKRKEKLYEVIQIAGMPYSRLVKINGENLSEKQIKLQNEREEKARQRMMEHKPVERGERQVPWLTQDLVGRYVFAVVRREVVNDRPALVLSFKPKAQNVTVKKIEDRMLNKLSGTIWVDGQEYEIIQADLHLSERVSLWGGVLGVLDKLNFSMVRRRVEDGIWFNQVSTVLIEGRKLFDSLRLRTKEEASDFKKVEFPSGSR